MPHIHEKIDFVAEAYIVNDGRVLLRKHDKYKQWFPVGGQELDDPVYGISDRIKYYAHAALTALL